MIHYEPGIGTESMYTRIDEIHDGSEYDPIPYEDNMILVNGLYYTQKNGLCQLFVVQRLRQSITFLKNF